MKGFLSYLNRLTLVLCSCGTLLLPQASISQTVTAPSELHVDFSTSCTIRDDNLGGVFQRSSIGTMFVFTFWNSKGQIIGREFVRAATAGEKTVSTVSITPKDVAAESSRLSCSTVTPPNPDVITLTKTDCPRSNLVVDNGPIATFKQAAIFNHAVRIMLLVSEEKFFAEGTSSLTGLRIFARANPDGVTVHKSLSGLEPQTIILDIEKLPRGSHEIIYGFAYETSEQTMGHICFSR